MGYPNAGKISFVSRDVRALAAAIPAHDRAKLIREVVFQVREAVKSDSSTEDAPRGRKWELDRLNQLYALANTYWTETLAAPSSDTTRS